MEPNRLRTRILMWAEEETRLGYQTPAAYADRLTATGGRLRGTETLRQPPMAPSARERHSEAPTPVSAG